MKLIDPQVLSKIPRLSIRVQSVMEGVLAGMHSSKYVGHSMEFSQHREYAPGDEPRKIDWKMFARSDRFFIKEFQDETNLRAYILLDISRSMDFKNTNALTKLSYATILAASLAYILINQSDSAGLCTFSDNISYFLPSKCSSSHLALIYDALENAGTGKDTSIAKVLDEFSAKLSKRSLIFLISDLLDDESQVIKALRRMRSRHHDIEVFQVLDDAEVALDFNSTMMFKGLEIPEQIQVDPREIRKHYSSLFRSFLNSYKSAFMSANISYHEVHTSIPLELTLARSLKRK